MRIGELSTRTGASVRSIRYYEQQGLLVSTRTGQGQRIFGEAAVDRIVLIRRLFDAGLSSTIMADLLPCITDPSARTPYLAQRLREERERIIIQIERMSQAADSLALVIDELSQEPPVESGRSA